jgi:hypothetical protein
MVGAMVAGWALSIWMDLAHPEPILVAVFLSWLIQIPLQKTITITPHELTVRRWWQVVLRRRGTVCHIWPDRKLVRLASGTWVLGQPEPLVLPRCDTTLLTDACRRAGMKVEERSKVRTDGQGRQLGPDATLYAAGVGGIACGAVLLALGGGDLITALALALIVAGIIAIGSGWAISPPPLEPDGGVPKEES